MENALATLPAELSMAYQEVVDRISKTDEESGDAGMRILTWIFHAARPLQMVELRVALDVEDGYSNLDDEPQFSNDDILEMCQSLVVYEESSGVVRFVHPSVQEFLNTCNLSAIHLARTCLTILENNSFDDTCLDWGSMESRLKRNMFCRYFVQFWGFHVRGEAETLPDIQETVIRLLSSEGKRNFIVRMEGSRRYWSRVFGAGQTVLHILAANGLATLSRKLLDRTPNHETYSFVVDKADSEKLTIHLPTDKARQFESKR
jgi:hypothetical protein